MSVFLRKWLLNLKSGLTGMYRNDAEFLIKRLVCLNIANFDTEQSRQSGTSKKSFLKIEKISLWVYWLQLSYSNQPVMLFSGFLEKLEMMDVC